MIKVDPSQYFQFIGCAKANECGAVYPLSIAEGRQYGDIFTYSADNCQAVLFWHHSGFAYICGDADDSFLEEVYALMLDENKTNPRRFVLMLNDERTEAFFRAMDNLVTERRYLYEYAKTQSGADISLPEGCEMKAIDSKLLSALRGNIVPALFWNNADDFLKEGKGFSIVKGGDAAAWAFSAAISSEEIDIGIETNEHYRHQGLAAAAASMMIQYALSSGKKPVWACHYTNIASQKLAEKLGFEKKSECRIIKRKEWCR